jgi:hypothetical protein
MNLAEGAADNHISPIICLTTIDMTLCVTIQPGFA